MAVVFMISDGQGKYIKRDRTGVYVAASKSRGDVFEQRSTAKNVLENSLNLAMRKKYKVVEIETKPEETTVQKPAEKEVQQTVSDLNKQCNEYKEQINKWASEIDFFTQSIKNFEDRKNELLSMLSDIDKEICDIEHYIEFKKLNACDAWNIYSMLRTRLMKRREIKNELGVITHLLDCTINSNMVGNIKQEILNMDSKKYTPRKLTALFE